jgi:tetratricopeptide (TPR) repeat protein
MNDMSSASEQAARAAFVQRDWAAVLAATSESLASDPSSTESRRMRGWALYHLGRYDEGLEDFAELSKLDPNLTDAALGSGRCQRMLGRIDESAADFWHAHLLSPEDPHPLCERGAALILDERWEEALADYQAAAALDPNHPGLASYFAELYLYSGRPGDALDAARAGLEREPGSVMHRVNLAHALLFSGQHEAAIAEYETVRDRIAVSEHVNGGAIVLNDLALMREVGLVCDGFDEVEARMREPAGG